jgi:hypothetical protein
VVKTRVRVLCAGERLASEVRGVKCGCSCLVLELPLLSVDSCRRLLGSDLMVLFVFTLGFDVDQMMFVGISN